MSMAEAHGIISKGNDPQGGGGMGYAADCDQSRVLMGGESLSDTSFLETFSPKEKRAARKPMPPGGTHPPFLNFLGAEMKTTSQELHG
jgi:hypothetical protein